MRVQSIQNNNTNFKGEIPKTEIINRYIDKAVEMAQSSKDSESRKKSLEFFNTLYAMKNDGTYNKLSIKPKYPKVFKTIGISQYNSDYIVQYGDLSKGKVFYMDVINTIIKFGRMLFGDEIGIAKPKEVAAALKSQENADTVYATNEAARELQEQEFNKVQQKASDEYKNAFETLLK